MYRRLALRRGLRVERRHTSRGLFSGVPVRPGLSQKQALDGTEHTGESGLAALDTPPSTPANPRRPLGTPACGDEAAARMGHPTSGPRLWQVCGNGPGNGPGMQAVASYSRIGSDRVANYSPKADLTAHFAIIPIFFVTLYLNNDVLLMRASF